MPLDTSTNESTIRDICNYIQSADIFFSTHTTTTNKWCLGLNAEHSKIATLLESFLSHIIKDRTIKIYSNETATQWCKGKLITINNILTFFVFQPNHSRRTWSPFKRKEVFLCH